MRHGALTLHLPDGSQRRYGEHPQQGHGPTASLTLHNWKVFSAALKSGDIGFAEGYIAGDWSTPDLTALLKVLKSKHGFVIDGGYGKLKGKTFRISNMGDETDETIATLLRALDSALMETPKLPAA